MPISSDLEIFTKTAIVNSQKVILLVSKAEEYNDK